MIAEHRIDAFSFVRLFLNVSTIRGFGLFIVHEFGFGLLTCPLLGGHFTLFRYTLDETLYCGRYLAIVQRRVHFLINL